jgi:hypothetical protein
VQYDAAEDRSRIAHAIIPLNSYRWLEARESEAAPPSRTVRLCGIQATRDRRASVSGGAVASVDDRSSTKETVDATRRTSLVAPLGPAQSMTKIVAVISTSASGGILPPGDHREWREPVVKRLFRLWLLSPEPLQGQGCG